MIHGKLLQLLSSVHKLLTQASDVDMEHNIIDYTICMNMQTFHEQCLRVSMSFCVFSQ